MQSLTEGIPDTPDKEGDQALHELRQEYMQGVPERLARLQRLLPLAKNGSDEALQEIILDAHRIRGTARLFDVSWLGQQMGQLEDKLSDGETANELSTWHYVERLLLESIKALTLERNEVE